MNDASASSSRQEGAISTTDAPELDKEALVKFQQKVWGYRQGELVALMMYLGDQLGLYTALAEVGTVTASDLAAHTGLHERWLLEWLRSQAAARLVESDDGVTFTLPPEGAAVLADSSLLTYAGSALSGPRPPETVSRVMDAFRTGVGLTYDDHGADEAHHVERAFGNWLEHVLVPKYVPAIGGLAESLTNGAKVADVGCGGGHALRLLADAFPSGSYHGYDISEHAIDLAESRTAEGGQQISFHRAGSADMGDDGPFDVILTLDCLHDMAHPERAAADIRSAIADDGVWLIKEIRSSADFQKNMRYPLLAMMYATSVMVCMSSSMSEPGGIGYGTLGLNPEALEDLVKAAGFSSIVTHDFEDPANLYYEVRP